MRAAYWIMLPELPFIWRRIGAITTLLVVGAVALLLPSVVAMNIFVLNAVGEPLELPAHNIASQAATALQDEE